MDLLELDPHERAAAGLFLGFQYPVEIPGVSNVQFLREALNAQRKYRGEEPLSGGEFLKLAREIPIDCASVRADRKSTQSSCASAARDACVDVGMQTEIVGVDVEAMHAVRRWMIEAHWW